ncbi:unnamed protein product [Diplocarpon coronariae]
MSSGVYTLLELCAASGRSGYEDVRYNVFGQQIMADTYCRAASHVDYSLSFNQICDVVLMHHVTHHGHYTKHRRSEFLVKGLQRFHSSLSISLQHCMHSLE